MEPAEAPVSVVYDHMEVIESGRNKSGWFFRVDVIPDSVFHVSGESEVFTVGDIVKVTFERKAAHDLPSQPSV